MEVCTEAKKVVVTESYEKVTKSKIEGSSTHSIQSGKTVKERGDQKEDRAE